ncbi:hypothetical protein CHU95_17795 [Niveispirillum lacus]|uniref:Energy transducer TonB n=1 Tax=Niveispirillum lacus TaxID=1981099 RepID=A0A255YTR7_9PROT|nr:hypothetical protein [Niveispirillum lacus]OYQ32627.1 hypothetical protein CHU95_17795 [Niveispirillum lacus]
MRTTLILSGILHLAVIVLALIGLPHLVKKREVIQLQEVPVDVVEVGPMTIAKLAEPNPKPLPPPPKPTPPKPEPPPPPQQAREAPPPPPEVKVPEPPKQVAEKPPEPEPPKPEPKPEPPKKEEPKPEPPKKEEPKPKPPEPKKEEPKPKKEEPKPKPPEKTLDSVLKNVAKLKTDSPPSKEPPKPDAQPPQPLAARTGERLSISEEDALRRQIRNCWNVPVGAKGIENMQAEIRVLFDASLRVTNVQYVSGTGNPNTDPHFRAFVESALRAPLLPGCNTLNIPRDKYGDKGSILMKFSPKDMF